MRKFNFKVLLVAVLAALMVFALAACDPKEPDPGPTPPPKVTAADYFNTLWEKTKEIGDETIGVGKNVAIDLDLQLELGYRRSNGLSTNEKATYGLKVEGILDRESTATDDPTVYTSKNTALKATLYDPLNHDAVLISACVYIDSQKAYVDIGSRHYVMGISELTNLGYTIGRESRNPFKGTNISFEDIIAALTKDMGEDWDLNSLIGVVIDIAGNFIPAEGIQFGVKTFYSIPELVQFIDHSIASLLFPDEDNPTIMEGDKINVSKILTSDMLDSFLVGTDKKSANGVDTYETSLGTMIMNIITTALQNVAPELVDVDGNASAFTNKLTYDIKDNALDSFTVDLGLKAKTFRRKVGTYSDCYPYLILKIKDLDFGAVQPTDAIEPEFEEAAYKESIAFEEKVELQLEGIKVDRTILNMAGAEEEEGVIDLSGTNIGVVLNANVKLNAENAAKAIKGYLEVTIDNTPVIKFSINDGTVAAVVDRTVKIGGDDGLPVIDTIIQYGGKAIIDAIKEQFFKDNPEFVDEIADVMFAKTGENQIDYTRLADNFKGLCWEDVDIDFFVNFIWGKIKEGLHIGTPAAQAMAEPTEDPQPVTASQIVKAIAAILKYVVINNGKLGVEVDSVIDALIETSDPFTKPNEKWTLDGCIESILVCGGNTWASEKLRTALSKFSVDGVEAQQGEAAEHALLRAMLEASGKAYIDGNQIVAELHNGNASIKASLTHTFKEDNFVPVDVAEQYRQDQTGWFHKDLNPEN